MTNLYPFKFIPILKERVWGGDALVKRWGKSGSEELRIGESWEISGLQGDTSVVANGFLEGNSIDELLEVYMGDLVGEDIYEKFGNEFPLLIKLIDAKEMLSVQVHPNDTLALERHSSYGKTELWYILESGEESLVYSGFKEEVTRENFIKSLESGNISELLHKKSPVPGDSILIPAGTIHSCGKDLFLLEIQQVSDITYRLHDWGRLDASGTPRELHTDLALEAVELTETGLALDHLISSPNLPVEISKSKYFNVNLLTNIGKTTKDYTLRDSFIIYICIEGSAEIESDGIMVSISMGETVLIPAISNFVEISSSLEAKLIEVYIEPEKIN